MAGNDGDNNVRPDGEERQVIGDAIDEGLPGAPQ
jgi:hypothetical protein